jgi:hypothetical protein
VLQTIEEQRLVGCNPQHAQGGQPQQVTPVPNPPSAGEGVECQQNQGGAENPDRHQGARGEVGEDKTAHNGQTGKEELNRYQGEMD